MKTLCIIAATALVILLQMKVKIFGIAPAMTVIMVYYLGIQFGSAKGMLFGSIIGTIEDSIVGGLIGPNLLGKGMVGFFSSFVTGGIFRWTPFLGALAVFTLTFVDGVAVFLSRMIFETQPAPPSRAIFEVLMQGLLSGVAGIFIRPSNAE